MNRSVVLIIVFICLFAIDKLSAQESSGANYTNAIGLRAGEISGITFNYKFDERNSIKFIGGVFPDVYGLAVLYERFYKTRAQGLDLYFGIGGHVSGAYHRRRDYYIIDTKRYSYERNYGYSSILGIDIVGGVEYKFPKIPFALCADFKPFMEFFNGYGPYFKLDPSMGVKYAF